MGYFTDALEHHGVKGQKWGVRRYQNYDGKRTADAVVWDKSFKETKKMAKDLEAEGKTYYDFTDRDWEAIDKVKKMGGKGK